MILVNYQTKSFNNFPLTFLKYDFVVYCQPVFMMSFTMNKNYHYKLLL